MMLDMRAGGCAINLVDSSNRLHHLMHSLDQKAAFLMGDNFWGRPTTKGNDRTPYRHCLDHHHAKWFFPLDGVEQATGAAKQIHLLLHVYWANVRDLLLVKMRLDLLLKVHH